MGIPEASAAEHPRGRGRDGVRYRLTGTELLSRFVIGRIVLLAGVMLMSRAEIIVSRREIF